MRDSNSKEINLSELQIHVGSKVSIFVHWSKNDVILNHDRELINTLALEFDQIIVMCNLNKTKSVNKNDQNEFSKNVKLVKRKCIYFFQKCINILKRNIPCINNISL